MIIKIFISHQFSTAFVGTPECSGTDLTSKFDRQKFFAANNL
jgi:hypothetical protein